MTNLTTKKSCGVRIRAAALAFIAFGQAAMAEPVEISIIAPDDLGDTGIAWEAIPLDTPEATTKVKPVWSGKPVVGPWRAMLEPGMWQIVGMTEKDMLNGMIAVTETAVFEIPLQEPPPPPPFSCGEGVACPFQDDTAKIEFRLPAGWGGDQPVVSADNGKVSMVMFEEDVMNGGRAWFLNPVEWTDATGPCREVALGQLCAFSLDAEAEAAFGIIAPSLRQTGS